MTRYFEWDYVADTVIEYRRKGKCKKCGACCEASVQFSVNSPYKRSLKHGGRKTDGRGIWQEVHKGRWRYSFRVDKIDVDSPTICGELNDDKLCDIHNDKCLLCREWPFSVRCIMPFPDCGYSFEEIQRGRISELKEDKK